MSARIGTELLLKYNDRKGGSGALPLRAIEVKSLLLVLILAGGLRFSGITFDSLWLDESYQSMAGAFGQPLPNFLETREQPYLFKFGSPQPLATVLANFRQVDPLCPPLYAVLLNRWMVAFGESDLAVRSLSAFLSLASVCALFFGARAFFGIRTAILAAILQSVSPFDIHYAQEARMYSLIFLSSLLSCGSLLGLLLPRTQAAIATSQSQSGPSAMEEPKGLEGWLSNRIVLGAIYVVSTWAMINAHYTTLFTVAFQGLYGFYVCLTRKDLKLLAGLGACGSLVLLAWLPWFEMFRQAAANRTASFYVQRAASWFWPLWALLIRLPLNWLAFLAGKKVVAYALPLYFTSAAMLLIAAFVSLPGAIKSKVRAMIPPLAKSTFAAAEPTYTTRAAMAFMWAWAFFPGFGLWLVDVIENHRVIEMARYLMASAPSIYILAGLGLASVWTRTRLAHVLLFTHIALALLNNAHAHARPQREPWAEMARTVESFYQSDDLVLVSQYYDIVCLNRYLSRPLAQVGITPGHSAKDIEDLIRGRHRIWLLTAQEGDAAKNLMPADLKLTRQIDLSHGLHLRLYLRDQPL